MSWRIEQDNASKNTRSASARGNAGKENVNNVEKNTNAKEIGEKLNEKKNSYINTKLIYKELLGINFKNRAEAEIRTLKIMKLLAKIMLCLGMLFLSNSCTSPGYTEPEVHIKHSSPDVISLYNKPSKPKPSVGSRIASALIDDLLGSSADDDDFIGPDRYHSKKEKRAFTNKHKTSIQHSLRNKQ